MTDKKLKDSIVKNLYSNTSDLVILAIEEVSQSGNSKYIPMLIDILHSTKEKTIKEKAIKILTEVKHSDAVPELVKAIEDEKYTDEQELLIRACWENGLDFTNYFSTFVDLLINGNYMVAFEALTVIENTKGHLSETSAMEYIDRLKEALSKASEERKTLIHSIIHFLPSIINA